MQSFWADDVAVLAKRFPEARDSLLMAAGDAEGGVADAVAAGASVVGVAWPVNRLTVEAGRRAGSTS